MSRGSGWGECREDGWGVGEPLVGEEGSTELEVRSPFSVSGVGSEIERQDVGVRTPHEDVVHTSGEIVRPRFT